MDDQGTAILQYWLKAVVTTPGNLKHKLEKAGGLYGMTEHDVVAIAGKASSYARLNVYATGYVLRLLECLVADFPVLLQFLGDDAFEAFAKASLTYSPPVSYTLYDLGKNFIVFLEATRPRTPDGKPIDDPMLDLPIEMAKLERARQEAMRAKGTEEDRIPATDLSLDQLLFGTSDLIIATPPCLRLTELKFPLRSFFLSVISGAFSPLPAPQHTYIAVSRSSYRITMEELTVWQYHLLQACSHPTSLGTAISHIAKTANIPPAQLMADLYLWLPLFIDNGFLICKEDMLSAS